MGADATAFDAFFMTKTVDTENSAGAGMVPRGLGYLYGADAYWMFSQIVFGDDSVLEDPEMVTRDPVTFFLSGFMTWMIPMNGKPAPHNIMLGQWEPSWEE